MEGEINKLKILDELSEKLANTRIYHDFFKNLQEAARDSTDVSLVNINEFLLDRIDDMGISKQINNLILTNHDELTSNNHSQSSSTYINKSQANWERKLTKSLNSICTDHNMPLSKKRSQAEGNEIRKLWNELGTNVPELKKFRNIYTIREFLDHILAIKCSNLTDLASRSMTGLLSVPIQIKSIDELKSQYKQASIEYFQSGLDDALNSHIEQERFKTGKKVVDVNDALLSKQFAKQGCSRGLRGTLWAQILNVHMSAQDVLYYNYLKQCVLEHDLLIDSIYYKDVKTIAVNDDQVFVFEDLLYQVLLIFSRDTHVLQCFEKSSIQVPKAFIKTANDASNQNTNSSNKDPYHQVNYPPNGFLPFEGFSMLVAPICYVYSDPIHLYFIFRKLFMTYFYKLTIISCDPQSILGLCVLFENFLQCKDPKVFNHLRKLDVQPLSIVFKWLVRCYSGFLASSQVLELWDRILAFNSLEILSIFAVGVFVYRRENLLSAVNKNHVEAILEDLTSLKVVAILQLVFI